MSKSIKYLVAVGLIVTVAACGRNKQEEYVVVEPEPVSVEPTYTSKYK